MENTGWFYMKSGLFQDSRIGPLGDEELMEFAFEGRIQPKTLIASTVHTKGHWVHADQLPVLIAKFAEGESHRAADKERHKLAKDIERKSREIASVQMKEIEAAERMRCQVESPPFIPQQPLTSTTAPTTTFFVLPSEWDSRVVVGAVLGILSFTTGAIGIMTASILNGGLWAAITIGMGVSGLACLATAKTRYGAFLTGFLCILGCLVGALILFGTVSAKSDLDRQLESIRRSF